MGGPGAVPAGSDRFGPGSIASDAAATVQSSPSTPVQRSPQRLSNSSPSPNSPSKRNSGGLLHSGKLLGDLPSLDAHRSPQPEAKHHQDSKPTASPQSVQSPTSTAEVPHEFLCEITRKPLEDPVITPSGHVFERKVIEGWIERNGSICPITAQPLSIFQLREAADLKQRMAAWKLKDTLERTGGESKSQFADQGTGNDDLYEF